jgi:putative PIN family toxin of toxin-antitoxin system
LSLPKVATAKYTTLFFDGRNTLCVSTEILEEYEEILYRLTNKEVAANIIDAIVNNPYTLEVQPFYKFNLIQQDPDDNKFVDCAIVSHARYLVTEDKHFRVLKDIPFPSVHVIGIDDFLNEIRKHKV